MRARARTCRGAAAGRAVIIPVDGGCTIGLEVIELDDVDATRRASDHRARLSDGQTDRQTARECVRVCVSERMTSVVNGVQSSARYSSPSSRVYVRGSDANRSLGRPTDAGPTGMDRRRCRARWVVELI